MNASEIFSYIILFGIPAGFIWFVIDTHFLTHYGGKPNRGLKVWSRPLAGDERKFLTNLNQDIVETEEYGKLVKRKSVSFITICNGEALIRYTNPHQGTSWPMVFYSDLTFPTPELEYRMSLPGLLLWLAMAMGLPVRDLIVGNNPGNSLFFLAFFVLMLGASIFSEVNGTQKFLARQVGIDLQSSQTILSK